MTYLLDHIFPQKCRITDKFRNNISRILYIVQKTSNLVNEGTFMLQFRSVWGHEFLWHFKLYASKIQSWKIYEEDNFLKILLYWSRITCPLHKIAFFQALQIPPIFLPPTFTSRFMSNLRQFWSYLWDDISYQPSLYSEK